MNGCVAHRSIGNGQMVVEALVIVAHNSTSITSKKFAKASHCAEILFLPFLFLFFFFFFFGRLFPSFEAFNVSRFTSWHYLSTSIFCIRPTDFACKMSMFSFSRTLRWKREIIKEFHSSLSSFPSKDTQALSNELPFPWILANKKGRMEK